MSQSSSGRRRLGVVASAAAVAIVVTGAGYAVAAGLERPTVLGPGDVTVEVGIEYSKFLLERLTVAEGTRVRFLVVNRDPILHELITGGSEVHRRHANGTEAKHPSVPGEVSVLPNDSAITTFTFEKPGVYEFACHLPGHYEYGMRGEIEVVAGT